MGSIDRWAKNQIAKDRAQERRSNLRDQATEKWTEAKAATTRQEAATLIEEMRVILRRHHSLWLSDICITEQEVIQLLLSKS